MSWYAMIGKNKMVPLATFSGWAEAKQWIETLPAREYPSLIQFAVDAWTQGAGDMRRQIVSALEKFPPNDDVRAIMADLANELRWQRHDAVVFVSDGFEYDDDDPETEEPPTRQPSRENDPLFSNPTPKARKRKPAKRKAAKRKSTDRKTTAQEPKRRKPTKRTPKRRR